MLVAAALRCPRLGCACACHERQNLFLIHIYLAHLKMIGEEGNLPSMCLPKVGGGVKGKIPEIGFCAESRRFYIS